MMPSAVISSAGTNTIDASFDACSEMMTNEKVPAHSGTSHHQYSFPPGKPSLSATYSENDTKTISQTSFGGTRGLKCFQYPNAPIRFADPGRCGTGIRNPFARTSSHKNKADPPTRNIVKLYSRAKLRSHSRSVHTCRSSICWCVWLLVAFVLIGEYSCCSG